MPMLSIRLLQKLSAATQGKFYTAQDMAKLPLAWKTSAPMALIHSDETYNPLINLKWFFFLLLTLVSAEWFLRKWMGSY